MAKVFCFSLYPLLDNFRFQCPAVSNRTEVTCTLPEFGFNHSRQWPQDGHRAERCDGLERKARCCHQGWAARGARSKHHLQRDPLSHPPPSAQHLTCLARVQPAVGTPAHRGRGETGCPSQSVRQERAGDSSRLHLCSAQALGGLKNAHRHWRGPSTLPWPPVTTLMSSGDAQNHA